MANSKISALTSATTPLAGTETLPVVQSSTTKQVSVANLTAGRSVSAASFIPSSSTIPTNGVYLPIANAVGLAANSAHICMADSSGSFIVGTTSTNIFSNNNGNFIGASDIITKHASGTSTGAFYAGFLYDASIIGSISQSGTTNVLYNTSSDYRLKNITGSVTGAKDFIMALKPKKGTWKSDGSPFVGFLAHEFQEVSPSSVAGEKDAVDSAGNPMMQGMQASSPEVMANLVALLQEQIATIDALTNRIVALETK